MTNDNFQLVGIKMSSRKSTRSSQKKASDPPSTPAEVHTRPLPRSSSISEISSPCLSRINEDQIFAVATNGIASPLLPRRCDPPATHHSTQNHYDAMEEEEEYDFIRNAGGASDSEDEDDIGLDNDRHNYLDGTIAATLSDGDFIPSGEVSNSRVIPGAPVEWKPPGPPEGWVPPQPIRNTTVPDFEDVDNPGQWSSFTFQPKYKRDARGKLSDCLYHALPTGATPVPADGNGKRI